jgi:hypothetical protein
MNKQKNINKYTWIGFGAFMVVLLAIGSRIYMLDDDPSMIWWQDFWTWVWVGVFLQMVDFAFYGPLTRFIWPFIAKSFLKALAFIFKIFSKK